MGTTSVRLDQITKSFNGTDVITGVSLEVKKGELVVFVGPSGCGKSTLLRLIAGLETPTSGALFIDDQDVTCAHPSRRGVAMVFQSYALYPHMTVFDNIAFALKIKGVPGDEIRAKVESVAEILQLETLLKRLPKALSGGQRQRVAIGRAMVREPAVFLFDEPLSNLDASLRGQMRVEIARLHAKLGATSIYVTHDQIEAMTLADKIVVLNQGRIEQIGTPMELYRKPANLFVATFLGSPGMNILPVTLAGADKARVTLDTPQGQITLPRKGVNATIGAAVSLGLRPESLSLSLPGSAQFTGHVTLLERLGGETFAYVALTGFAGNQVILKLDGEAELVIHQQVYLALDPRRTHLFDEAGVAMGQMPDLAKADADV